MENKIKLILEKIDVLRRQDTWFKVGDFILGYQTDDWPSSRNKLLIVDKDDIYKIKPIKHQVIN